MILPITNFQFTIRQEEYIEKGGLHFDYVKNLLEKTIHDSISLKHPHLYLSSSPGYGKTTIAKKILDESGKKYINISGAVSTFQIGMDLMVEHFKKKNGEKIIVLIDDSDGIFHSLEDLSIMKNILEGKRSYQRRKSTPLSMLSDFQKTILPYYRIEDGMGIEVPCEDFIFIILSNKNLPTDSDIKELLQLTGNAYSVSTEKKIALNAIRSRCKTKNISMPWFEEWGYIAHILINEECLSHIDNSGKNIILNWMYNNWNIMVETSIRTAEKMADIMKFEKNYLDAWDIEFISKL